MSVPSLLFNSTDMHNTSDDVVGKRAAYDALVTSRKACRACTGLTNPAVVCDGAHDVNELGSWTAWQGNLNAALMVIGQDWGDVAWFEREKGLPTNWSKTNRTLQKLLESVGVKISLPIDTPRPGVAFFTNAILCLKQDGAQAAVKDQWFRNCGSRYLRPTIDLIRPKVVVTLGDRAYRALSNAYGVKPGSFREAVEQQLPITLPNGVMTFAVYHCGARILNTHRKLGQQLGDWKRIEPFLAGSQSRR